MREEDDLEKDDGSLSWLQEGGAANKKKKVTKGYCISDLFAFVDKVYPLFRDSSSQSIVVLGRLNPSVMRTSTQREAMIKMHLQTSADDNALETEISIYMMLRDKIAPISPHVLAGLYHGQCSDKELLEFRTSADPFLREVFRSWFAMRLLKRPWTAAEEAKAFAMVQEPGFKMSAKPLRFVLTPRIGDVTFADFMLADDWRLARSDLTQVDLLTLVLQAAQVLGCLAQERVMHHNLSAQNWMVRKFPMQRPVAYTVPERSVLNTRFRMTIFNFEHGSAEHLPENTSLRSLCTSRGECDKYQINFDWYTFLSDFERVVQQSDQADKLPDIVTDLLKGSEKTTDAAFGRPCACTEQKNGRCAKCVLKKTFLEQVMPTPWKVFHDVHRGKRDGVFL